MAITLVGTSTSSSVSGSPLKLTISKPTGTADGDYIFLAFQDGPDSRGAPVFPAGFTSLATVGTSGTDQLFVYYRIASSEPSSYQITLGYTFDGKGNTTQETAACCVAATYRGLSGLGTSTSDFLHNTTSHTFTMSSLTSTSAQDVLLHFTTAGPFQNVTSSACTVSGATQEAVASSSILAGLIRVWQFDEALTSAGSTGTRSIAFTVNAASDQGYFSVILEAATSGGGSSGGGGSSSGHTTSGSSSSGISGICLQLSQAELAALLSQGYTLLGGPYASQSLCLAQCGSSPVHSSSGGGATGPYSVDMTAQGIIGTSIYASRSDAGAPSGSAARALSLWVKLSAVQSDSFNFNGIFAYGTSTTSELYGLAQGNSLWEAMTGPGPGNGDPYGSPTANTWYHLVVTQDGSGNYKYYVNGTLIHNSTHTVNTVLSGTMQIGGPFGVAYGLDGWITDVRFYTIDLTAANVTTLYNGGTPTWNVDTIGSLWAWWQCQDGSGSTLSDSSGNSRPMTLTGAYAWSTDVP